jgi:hypothetical protein
MNDPNAHWFIKNNPALKRQYKDQIANDVASDVPVDEMRKDLTELAYKTITGEPTEQEIKEYGDQAQGVADRRAIDNYLIYLNGDGDKMPGVPDAKIPEMWRNALNDFVRPSRNQRQPQQTRVDNSPEHQAWRNEQSGEQRPEGVDPADWRRYLASKGGKKNPVYHPDSYEVDIRDQYYPAKGKRLKHPYGQMYGSVTNIHIGDKVKHNLRPEWGIGTVSAVSPVEREGKSYQMITVSGWERHEMQSVGTGKKDKDGKEKMAETMVTYPRVLIAMPGTIEVVEPAAGRVTKEYREFVADVMLEMMDEMEMLHHALMLEDTELTPEDLECLKC